MLMASGVGSRQAARFSSVQIFGGIIGISLLLIFAWQPVTAALVQLPLFARVAVTVLFLGPLGFFMGMPFPTAVRRVGEFVDWGFAIGGAGSVVGSTLAVLIAFTMGFKVALLAGCVAYAAAAVLMSRQRQW